MNKIAVTQRPFTTTYRRLELHVLARRPSQSKKDERRCMVCTISHSNSRMPKECKIIE